MIYVLQLLIAAAVGAFCIYTGLKNGFVMAAYMFMAAYGLTIWLPEKFRSLARWRRQRRRGLPAKQ